MNYCGNGQCDNAVRFLAYFDRDREDSPLSLQTSAWVEYHNNENRFDQIQTSLVALHTAQKYKYFVLDPELDISHGSDLETSLYDT
jgi:hypothetical protein